MKNVHYLFVFWECCTKLWSASLSEDTNELAFISPPAGHTRLREKRNHEFFRFPLISDFTGSETIINWFLYT